MDNSNCNNLSNKVSGIFRNYFTYLSKVGYKKDDATFVLVVITFLHDLLKGKYWDLNEEEILLVNGALRCLMKDPCLNDLPCISNNDNYYIL